MDKSVQITLIIVSAIVLLAMLGGYYFFQLMPAGNTITTQGNSQIKVTPDLVTVYFTAETSGETAKEAKDKNAEIVDSLITELVKQGFERKDIQTQSFNIYPHQVWENNKYVQKGYKAVHQIKVELSTARTDKIGEVIDAGVDSGATINYINFELSQSKQNEYKAQALKQATEDAKTKAEAIALGAEKKLGKLVSISSNEFYYQPWRLYDAVAGASAESAKQAVTNIQPGTQDVTASVSAVYKIV